MGTKDVTDIKPSSLAIFAAPKEGAEPANENERSREGCTQAFQKLRPHASSGCPVRRTMSFSRTKPMFSEKSATSPAACRNSASDRTD